MINKVFIYKLDSTGRSLSLIAEHTLLGHKQFCRVCLAFQFSYQPSLERSSLLFASMDMLLRLNFLTGKITIIYRFKNRFKFQPQFFKMNDDETVFIVATEQDSLYVNTQTQTEVDIDK